METNGHGRQLRLFIGSSNEGADVAYKIQELLDGNCDVTVWKHGVFEPGATGIESLVQALDDYDFAAFVFTPDDLAKIRQKTESIPRDNVVFELGLFLGRLGRDRCFLLLA